MVSSGLNAMAIALVAIVIFPGCHGYGSGVLESLHDAGLRMYCGMMGVMGLRVSGSAANQVVGLVMGRGGPSLSRPTNKALICSQ